MENTTSTPKTEETFTDSIVEKTPWWFMSAFAHAILFALSALIVVMAAPDTTDEVVVVAAPRTPPPEPQIEEPPDFTRPEKEFKIEKTADDPIFKNPTKPNPTETENESELRTNRGDSMDFKSNKPFKGPSLNEAIGTGPGGGGKLGRPEGGGILDAAIDGGGGDNTEEALLDALKWLARHQNEDGSWSMKDHLNRCGRVPRLSGDCSPHGVYKGLNMEENDYDIGLTGLSLLAFLGGGYTHNSKDTYDGINFGDVVRGAIAHLIQHQDQDGCFGSRNVHGYMYNHLIGTLAMSEAYGLTGNGKFKSAAQRAVDFVMSAQNPGKAWRYIHQAGENDTSVTGWAVMALKSAAMSGLDFDRSVAYEGATAWLESASYKVAEAGTGRTTRWEAGYQFGAPEIVAIRGVNDHFDDHPSMTAISMMCRIFMTQKRNDPKVAGGAPSLMADLPKWDGAAIDFYYWYYGSLALYKYDGPDGPTWRKWNEAMVTALVDHQNRGGDKEGSWEPESRWSCKGGRVYATAINALTLEVYYRYPNAFGAEEK